MTKKAPSGKASKKPLRGRIRTRKKDKKTNGNTECDSTVEDEDKVGYGRPPKHTQFKPGKSGNSKGRPKGHKNFSTELAEEIYQKISIQEGGKVAKVSKQRLVIKTLFAKASKGDVRAINSLIALILQYLPKDHKADETEEKLSDEDQAILDELTNFVNNQERNGDKSND